MERKRAAIVVAICMLILLAGHQQKAAFASECESQFCKCFSSCYPDCRQSLPRWRCVLKCFGDCDLQTAAGMSADDCDKICLTSLGCMPPATGPTDAAACADDCSKNWRPSMKSH